ncbi:MAG: homoserine dehydrogenase [Candidatus Omnitrophica bacterium CG11_big_fil_rev_8_21_14_0_20_45_26]|uniref:Homoserine dehydrogenase n=1 Tax=Candidatus Abzuiibacterium crystallinum TaxID=1974748 RepID=A0A2H0LPS2_9BACT|nr:MAG: homoserine dehydrogenase [Candidatus Omnitrophica bacterium CG11_big_fil_rev_8_21_14_0_20_45_26]PIW63543.1 MAG: homoserine dehydrogenase [Candidatus Omnitrophica bacterium CG12_big_fil_rev_8_21_14_0_65_45_16]
MQILKIGLLGLGNIGSGVYSLIKRKNKLIAQQSGVRLEIVRIADRSRSLGISVPKHLLTQDVNQVVRHPHIDTVVELFGGVQPTLKFVLTALRSGKDVVTANKALLAEEGDQIFRMAERFDRKIFFEASVGGGIPVIQGLREGLVTNHIQSIHSIINGTSNYILSEMTERGLDFKTALKAAQQKGYAEANPTLDIEGGDAAHKITILASLAFGKMAKFKDVYVEGISAIRHEDIAFANEFGYRIKLLAIVKKSGDGVEARVQPTLIPKHHILADVNGSYNAILIRGDETGDVLFYGKGAGQKPTASAVVSDLATLGKARSASSPMRFPRGHLTVKNISTILSRYYFRFQVIDRPGMLAKISDVLGKHHISISDVIQKERRTGRVVPLILLTHGVHESAVRRAVHAIDRMPVVRGKTQVLRIEE